jgi:hypothetical protein
MCSNGHTKKRDQKEDPVSTVAVSFETTAESTEAADEDVESAVCATEKTAINANESKRLLGRTNPIPMSNHLAIVK